MQSSGNDSYMPASCHYLLYHRPHDTLSRTSQRSKPNAYSSALILLMSCGSIHIRTSSTSGNSIPFIASRRWYFYQEVSTLLLPSRTPEVQVGRLWFMFWTPGTTSSPLQRPLQRLKLTTYKQSTLQSTVLQALLSHMFAVIGETGVIEEKGANNQ